MNGSRLRRVVRWLIAEPEPLILYLFAAGLLSALACLWLPIEGDELKVRIGAFMLQAAGILTVAIDIRNTGKLFKRVSLVEQFRQWFARFPKGKHIVGSAGLSAGAASIKGEAAFRFGVSGSLNETEISMLRRRMEQLSQEVADIRVRLETHQSQHSVALEEERRRREVRDREIEKLLEESATGGLHLSLIGLAWLLVGVLLGSIPDVVARIIFTP